MTNDSVPGFLQIIRRSRLLHPAQLNELKLKILPGVDSVHVLAILLVQRGWLTPFQAERLREEDDAELVFGRYRVLDLLGKGGLCKVFKAWHEPSRALAALKVLHPDLRTNEEVLDQFRQEHEVLARLSHPAFVKVFPANEGGVRHFFAMEFEPGIDLQKLLQAAGPLPVGQTCDYVRQAALGLQYAYEQGLVHRDIKPANLFVHAAGGQLRILDIGLVRREWVAASAHDPNVPLMGTPDYLAPEQAANPHEADIRADIYSLGCTFYHLLTGQPPFPGKSLAEKLFQHQQAEPPSARSLRPDVSPELAAVVQKMMAKAAGDRHRTPAAVAAALSGFCQLEEQRIEPARFLPSAVDSGRIPPVGAAAIESQPAPAPAGEPPFGKPGFPERRAAPRRTGNAVSLLIAESPSSAEPLRGWVLNRSPGGLGLMVEDAVEIDTVVHVQPQGANLGARWFPVRVIYCFQERIRWRVGCQLVDRLSWDELRLFG
jgi:serine/threonine protein kinase